MYRSSCCNASFLMNGKSVLHNALVSFAFRFADVWAPGAIWTTRGFNFGPWGCLGHPWSCLEPWGSIAMTFLYSLLPYFEGFFCPLLKQFLVRSCAWRSSQRIP